MEGKADEDEELAGGGSGGPFLTPPPSSIPPPLLLLLTTVSGEESEETRTGLALSRIERGPGRGADAGGSVAALRTSSAGTLIHSRRFTIFFTAFMNKFSFADEGKEVEVVAGVVEER